MYKNILKIILEGIGIKMWRIDYEWEKHKYAIMHGIILSYL